MIQWIFTLNYFNNYLLDYEKLACIGLLLTLYLQYINHILIRWVFIEIIGCNNSLAGEQQSCIITTLTGQHLFVHKMSYMLQALDSYYSSRFLETFACCIQGVRSSDLVNLSICNATIERSHAYGGSSDPSSSYHYTEEQEMTHLISVW